MTLFDMYRRNPTLLHELLFFSLLFLLSLIMVGGRVSDVSAQDLEVPADQAAFSPEVVLITGSTSGLGREVALRVAATGAHVIIHGRNEERGAEVIAQIEESGTGSARFYRADLASLEEVRAFARTILADYDRLDVLINNAGIATTRSGEREVSTDGYELVFAVNYLSGFLLTHELLPLLKASAPARIINVSSLSQAPIDFDDVMLEQDYGGYRPYAQSKLAQIMFTIDLASELEGSGITVNSLHPATLMDTNMVSEIGIAPRTTVDEGAEAVMQLVLAPGLGSGQFFNGLKLGRANEQADDADARAQLRTLSLRLTGIQ